MHEKYVRSLIKQSEFDLVGEGVTTLEGEEIKARLEVALENGTDLNTMVELIHTFRRILDEHVKRRNAQMGNLIQGALIQNQLDYHQTLHGLELSTLPEEQKHLLAMQLNKGEHYEISVPAFEEHV
jgi:hypothetical protein